MRDIPTEPPWAICQGSAAYTIDALVLDLSFLPAVGKATAEPCDPDGIKTTAIFTNQFDDVRVSLNS